MSTLRIDIPEAFSEFIPAVIVRLTYLYPNFEFSAHKKEIVVKGKSGDLSDEVKREVMHQIYRERIYSETLSIRRWLSGD